MNPWGWFEERGKAAADALLRCGYKCLAVLVARICASYPWDCILTYDKIAEATASWYGHKPHRESVGRVVRLLARRGHLTSRRIFPGQPLPGLRVLSAHGTTAKDFPFRQLGERDPVPKHRRTRMRHELRARHRPAPESVDEAAGDRIAAPKFSSHIAATVTAPQASTADQRPKGLDAFPDLAQMYDGVMAHLEAEDSKHDARMHESVTRLRGPP